MEKRVIEDFIKYSKKKAGMPEVANKSEVAMVECAYQLVGNLYPGKYHAQVIKVCCDTLVASELEQIDAKISLMAGVVHSSMKDKEYDMKALEYEFNHPRTIK